MRTPVIVAELSASHCGSIARALDLVEAAAIAGADAVKLQTWSVITLSDEVLESGPWAGRRLRDLYDECRTPWDWHKPLFDRARELGITGFSTAFDPASVAFLEELQVPMHKIASFELTDIPLIECAAQTGKPLVISTGMATIAEIHDALAAPHVRRRATTLLRCVSAYPAPPEVFDLETMTDMRERFACKVGLSDHSRGSAAAAAATVLGAAMIEKHISLDERGPDGHFASSPEAFREMVTLVREVSRTLGEIRYGPTEGELAHVGLRRGLWVTRDVAAGEIFSNANVAPLRPARGLPPGSLYWVRGYRAARAIAAGTPLEPELINRDQAL